MQAFTPKKRLLAAAKKQQVDKPPCICPDGMMNMMCRDIMEKSNRLWPEAHLDAEKMTGPHVFGTGSPERIAQLVRSCYRRGVDIIAPACGLPTITPLANIQAMLEATRDVNAIGG